MNIKNILLVAGFLGLVGSAVAQCDTEAKLCDRYFDQSFISDGQEYRALLHSDQVAEFQTTLFGGNVYRMVSCSGEEAGELIFTLKDQEGNELFDSSNFGNTPYWDFNIESTAEVTINARLDKNKKSSGCAVILLGFKQ